MVPYRTPHNAYVNEYDTKRADRFPGHPVMVYEEGPDGNPIDPETVKARLGDEPLDPFPGEDIN